MAPRKAAERGTAGRDASAVPETGTPPRPVPERRYVDIDPWAVLLEGLMDMPEEVPAERKRPKGK